MHVQFPLQISFQFYTTEWLCFEREGCNLTCHDDFAPFIHINTHHKNCPLSSLKLFYFLWINNKTFTFKTLSWTRTNPNSLHSQRLVHTGSLSWLEETEPALVRFISPVLTAVIKRVCRTLFKTCQSLKTTFLLSFILQLLICARLLGVICPIFVFLAYSFSFFPRRLFSFSS